MVDREPDGSFSIISDTNTRQLSHVPTEKQTTLARARKPLMDTYFKRAAAKDLRWNVTLFPTEAHAMEAEMSLDEYEDIYYEACLRRRGGSGGRVEEDGGDDTRA